MSPDIVGINIPFSGWSKYAFEVADTVKSIDKDITTVLDGLHPSARSVECLSDSNVDFVVRGEGEQTISELVGALEQGKTEDLEKIKGIGFIKNGKTIITPPRPGDSRFRFSALSGKASTSDGNILCCSKGKPHKRSNPQTVGNNDQQQRLPARVHLLF